MVSYHWKISEIRFLVHCFSPFYGNLCTPLQQEKEQNFGTPATMATKDLYVSVVQHDDVHAYEGSCLENFITHKTQHGVWGKNFQLLSGWAFVYMGFEESEFGLLQRVKEFRNSRALHKPGSGGRCLSGFSTGWQGFCWDIAWNYFSQPLLCRCLPCGHTTWEGAVAPGSTWVQSNAH